MSELNERKYKLLGFLIIYIILMLCITIILMFLYLNYNIEIDLFAQKNKIESNTQNIDMPNNILEDEENIVSEQNDNSINNVEVDNYSDIKKPSDLDRYYINNIKCEEKEISYGKIVGYRYPNYIRRVTINYYEISGLKNKEIQDKINKEIKEKAESLISEEEIESSDIESIKVYANLNKGTSDLLSVSFSKSIDYNSKNNNYFSSNYSSLNYRLDTGEKLKLEDLFVKGTSIKNILSQTLYKEYAQRYGVFNDETGNGDMDYIDYGKVENDVFYSMMRFNNKENVNFWFDQEYITIEDYTIPTKDFPNDININNIVNTKESLYENGNNPKIEYAYLPPYMSSCDFLDKVSDDSYLSIFNSCNYAYLEGDSLQTDSYILSTKYIEEKTPIIISLINSDEKRNKGKGYVYNIDYVEYYENDHDEYVMSGEKVEVDLKDFEKNVDTLYALNARQATPGEFILCFKNLFYLPKVDYKVWDIIIKKERDGSYKMGQILYDRDYYNNEYEF